MRLAAGAFIPAAHLIDGRGGATCFPSFLQPLYSPFAEPIRAVAEFVQEWYEKGNAYGQGEV